MADDLDAELAELDRVQIVFAVDTGFELCGVPQAVVKHLYITLEALAKINAILEEEGA